MIGRIAVRLWPLSLACLFAACAITPAARVLKENPDLQRADGAAGKFEWKKVDQENYVVFYGKLKDTPNAGAGIYVGGSPDFKPPRDALTIKGKLGSFDVVWYPLKTDKARFYRTCLIDYQKATVKSGRRERSFITQRHVWVYADTEQALNSVIAELDKLRMFAAKPPDLVL